MEVLQGLQNLKHGKRPRAICVGSFDGFHLGHQYLLNRVCALARERDYESGIVTFEPLPAQFFAPPEQTPRRLITRRERIALADSLCCDLMAILDFDGDMAVWTAALFIDQILAQGLGAKMLVASSTHFMGHDRADINEIKEIASRFDIEVVGLPLLQLQALEVSSSAIREALWEGRAQDASTMLGRHYSLAGPVVGGRGMGRELGFPTANVKPPPEKLIPREGAYAGIATDETPGLPARRWPAAIFIGAAPTFELTVPTIEAHLLGESLPDLADHVLRLEFVHYLREPRKFSGAADLARQIGADVQATRELCHALDPQSGFGTFCPFTPRDREITCKPGDDDSIDT